MRILPLFALALIGCGAEPADPLDVWQCLGGRPPAVRGSPAQIFFTEQGDVVWWNAAATGQRYLLNRAEQAWQPYDPAPGAEDLVTGSTPDGEACSAPSDCASGLCVPTDDAGVCLSPSQPLQHVLTDGQQVWTAWLLAPPGGAPWRPVWLRRWDPDQRAFLGTAVTPVLAEHNRLGTDQGLSGRVAALRSGGALLRGIPSTPLAGTVDALASTYTPLDDPAWAAVSHITSRGGLRVVLRGGEGREQGVYLVGAPDQPADDWTRLSDCGGPCGEALDLLSLGEVAYLVRQDAGVLRIDASGATTMPTPPTTRIQAAHLDASGVLRVVGPEVDAEGTPGDAIWRLDGSTWWPEVRVLPEAAHYFAPDGAVFRFDPNREEACLEIADAQAR